MRPNAQIYLSSIYNNKKSILQSGGLNVKPSDSARLLAWTQHRSTVYKPSDFFQVSKYFNLTPLYGSCHLTFKVIVQNKKKKVNRHYLLTSMPFRLLYDFSFFRRTQKKRFTVMFTLLFSILWKKMITGALALQKAPENIIEVLYMIFAVYFKSAEHTSCRSLKMFRSTVALRSRLWFVHF